MTEYCCLCNKKHEGFHWKNQGNGWYCDKYFKPTYTEFVPQRIVEERKQFKKEITQPFRGGEVSKEFVDFYPQKAKKMFTEKEIKRAKNVWR